MFFMFSFLFAGQIEVFLSKVDGFNLSQYATWTPQNKQEKSSLYLPHYCWLEEGRTHATQTSHKCAQHGAMCLTISNGDTGKNFFFDALQKRQFNTWSYSESGQDCGIVLNRLQSIEQPETIVEIFCYRQRFSTELNTSLFKTCLAGSTYYRVLEREEEDREMRTRQMLPQGLYTVSGEFIPAEGVAGYMRRMSQTQC